MRLTLEASPDDENEYTKQEFSSENELRLIVSSEREREIVCLTCAKGNMSSGSSSSGSYFSLALVTAFKPDTLKQDTKTTTNE
jgi:hypothetical protein